MKNLRTTLSRVSSCISWSALAGLACGLVRAPVLMLILMIPVALPALSGCAALGMPVAQTFNERLASAYGAVTAVREATAIWLDAQVKAANEVSDQGRRDALVAAARVDAMNVQRQADSAREGLDVARGLRGIDVTKSEERLTSTLQILQALQKYLEVRAHEG